MTATELTTSMPGRSAIGIGSRHRSPVVLVGSMGWLALVLIVALTVQWLPLHNYGTIVGPANKSPNWSSEFLGTDSSGRSILSRLCFGARVSITIGFLSTFLAFLVGGFLGILAAYYRRVCNATVDVVANSILSVPTLLLLLAIVFAFGTHVTVLTLALGLLFVPAFMRLMRANALSLMSRDYISASFGMAATPVRIMFWEVLPNVAPRLVSYGVVVLPAIMVTEGALSFLGFGVPSPTPSWGGMIALGSQSLGVAWWPCVIPCLALAVTVFSLNTLGDYLRQRLEGPR